MIDAAIYLSLICLKLSIWSTAAWKSWCGISTASLLMLTCFPREEELHPCSWCYPLVFRLLLVFLLCLKAKVEFRFSLPSCCFHSCTRMFYSARFAVVFQPTLCTADSLGLLCKGAETQMQSGRCVTCPWRFFKHCSGVWIPCIVIYSFQMEQPAVSPPLSREPFKAPLTCVKHR